MKMRLLDLVLAIDAMVAVLDDEHTENLAGAQHGNAEEGTERVLTGLRTIGEGRVGRRVLEAERLGLRGDEADETFA